MQKHLISNESDSIVIAQITDLHIGFDGKGKVCQNSRRLEKVIQELNDMRLPPAMALLTGDLVEGGEDWAYAELRSLIKGFNCPVYLGVGNHDNREAFTKSLPEAEVNDGFVQYIIEGRSLRVIMLDTLKQGFHGGEFCERRKAWLEQSLAQKPNQPTLIAMHHPPIETGIAWMTAKEDAPWVQSFRDTIRKYDNIVHVISGHIHRTLFQKIENTTISVCEAVAPEVKLDLAPIDISAPDDRPLIRNSEPGYCLHHWNGKGLTSHASTASLAKPLVKFDKDHTFILRKTMDQT